MVNLEKKFQKALPIQILSTPIKRQTNQAGFLQSLAKLADKYLPSSQKILLTIDATIDQEEVTFYLNPEKLNKLQEFQQNQKFSDNYEFRVEQKLLKQLQQNGFFPRLFQDKNNPKKTYKSYGMGVAFVTCYNSLDNAKTLKQNGQKVIGTFLALDGDIFNKISKDYLDNNRCQEIISAHHWLINQTLKSVRTEVAEWLAVANTICVIVTGLGSICSYFILKNINVAVITAVFSLLFGLLKIFWKRLQPYLLRWIWQELINPQSRLRKKIATLMIKLG